MKLGTETGSVVNHIYGRATNGQPTPVVGMGATILCWTDRHAATITAVYESRCRVGKETKSLLHVEVKRDNAKVVKGTTMDGSAEYQYTPDPNAAVQAWRFQDNRWVALERSKRGGWKLCRGEGLRIGDRDEYHDPCF